MARIQYGALLTSIKGSIGNMTFSGVGNNATARTKPANRKQRTANQSMFLQLYREARVFYQSYDASGKLYLKNFVTLFPKYYGNARNPDEAAMLHFCRVYIYIKLVPDDIVVGVEFANIPAIYSITSIVKGTGTLHVNFSRDFGLNYYPFVFISKVRDTEIQAQSRLTSWMRPNSYSHSTYVDIYASYIERYGIAPVAGEKVWAGVILVGASNWHISDYSLSLITIT